MRQFAFAPAASRPLTAKLSRGQRQAGAIARSVFHKAKGLQLDEPTAAMGAKESALILDLAQRLKDGGEIAMIVTAHNCAQVSASATGSISSKGA